MTTHYMDEADRLCDRLAIIDRGKLLALDTPRALKAKAPGGTLLELVLDGDATPTAEIAETIERDSVAWRRARTWNPCARTAIARGRACRR